MHEAWRQIASLEIDDISAEFQEENLGAFDSVLAFDVSNYPATLTFCVYFKIILFVSAMKVKRYIRGSPVACNDKQEWKVTIFRLKRITLMNNLDVKTPKTDKQTKSRALSYGRNNNNEF